MPRHTRPIVFGIDVRNSIAIPYHEDSSRQSYGEGESVCTERPHYGAASPGLATNLSLFPSCGAPLQASPDCDSSQCHPSASLHPHSWDLGSSPTFWINHASRLLMRHFEQRLRPLDF